MYTTVPLPEPSYSQFERTKLEVHGSRKPYLTDPETYLLSPTHVVDYSIPAVDRTPMGCSNPVAGFKLVTVSYIVWI